MTSVSATHAAFFRSLRSFARCVDEDTRQLKTALDGARPPPQASQRDWGVLGSVSEQVAALRERSEKLEGLSKGASLGALAGSFARIVEGMRGRANAAEAALAQYGYEPPAEKVCEESMDLGCDDEDGAEVCATQEDEASPAKRARTVAEEASPAAAMDVFEKPAALPRTPTLDDLGISASGLAAITTHASQSPEPVSIVPASRSPAVDARVAVDIATSLPPPKAATADSCAPAQKRKRRDNESNDTLFPMLNELSQAEYEGAPVYLQTQLSLDAANAGIEMVNEVLTQKRFDGQDDWIRPSELAEFSSARFPKGKGKALLLLLTKLGRIKTAVRRGETVHFVK